MQVNVFNIDKRLRSDGLVDTAFSFSVFIEDIKQRICTEKTIRGEFYKLILDKISEYPELQGPIKIEDIAKYKLALELVYAVLAPPIVDENCFYWGIGTPVPGNLIYGTDAMQQFINGYNADPKTILNQGSDAFIKRLEEYVYRLILRKAYNISSEINSDSIYTRSDTADGLEKYFKIHIDTSFVEVKNKQSLPELNPELIEEFLQVGTGGEVLEDALPLSIFSIEGFSVVTVEDITAEQSIENIRLALTNESEDRNLLFEQVTHALQTLTGNSNIEFGLLPFLKVNGKMVYDTEECYTSVLVNAYAEQNIPEKIYDVVTGSYMKDPRAIFYNEINSDNARNKLYLTVLHKTGIVSYAVLPVYYNHKLAGVMEIYSKKSAIPFEKMLSKLEAAVPLLSQLLYNSSVQFNNRIGEVIKDQFTTLQNSVEWKFNEVAWNYLRQKRKNPEHDEIKTVAFKDVNPLYGAIDIRSSTTQRNIALQKDLSVLLTKLKEALTQVAKIDNKETYQDLISGGNTWLARIDKQITDNDEMNVKAFFETRVYKIFDELKSNFPETQAIIETFFAAADEINGAGFANRRELETSMGMINHALNNYFEKAQAKLQAIYPCYFETFRTDGVEYDIYTGQSLAPDVLFDDSKLNALRRWQLKSMIDIVQITDRLSSLMNCKLQTTQLIFVHSNPIDICFRKDERHFDVEGAYNVRYEVIKKRIDKVLIKSNQERLTQPGKIALVYSSDYEAEAFLNYIEEFQAKNLLMPDIEYHELEELQGVTGLKAIRLTVAIKKN